MKAKGWLWNGFLILLLMMAVTGGASSCAGKGASVKDASGQPAKAIAASPQQGAPVSGGVSQAPKVEKVSEAQVPPLRPEVKPPALTPRQAIRPTATPLPTPTATPAATPAPVPPPVPAPVAPPAARSEPPRGSGFVFNFDGADLYEVIRVMGEVMKMNYIIDPKVKGVVNIHTSGQVAAEDVFPIFQSILQLNGATAVKKDRIYEIVPLGDAKKLPFTPSQETVKSFPEEKYTIQIIPLKYIPVSEVSKMIKPFLSDGADIVEHPPLNILIIGDITSNVRKCLDVISLFDIDIFTDLKVRIYPIFNADVTEVAKEMERIFSSFEISSKSARGVGITFTPITRINSLLAISSIPNIFEKVENWLKQLDKTPAEETKLGVFVYYVQNGKAKDLADVLKQVYAPLKEKKAEIKGKAEAEKPVTPAPRGVRPTTPATPTTPTPPGKEEGGTLPEGEINVVVDETTNALIIRTYARDYKLVLQTIKKLDLYPKQVLIEIFLAEITLGDENKFGLEWSKFMGSFNVQGRQYDYSFGMGGTAVDPTKFLSGIRYAVEATDRLTAAIHASANDNRLKIISSPHILASNNKEAKIQIGTSQPILTNTYTTTGTVSTGVVEGTIEYKDIGIIVTVTPHINDGGLVTLDLSVEKSDVSTTSLGTLPSIPVFTKKTAKTILSIMGGQSIVLGGLIEDQKNVTKTGVPFLSRIPLLGALFGYQDYTKNKTEFLMLLTPHVITDLPQSNAVTREFREKIWGIKKEMEEREKEKK